MMGSDGKQPESPIFSRVSKESGGMGVKLKKAENGRKSAESFAKTLPMPDRVGKVFRK